MRRTLRWLVAALALCGMLASVGAAQAATPDAGPAAQAAAGPWVAPPVHGEPPAYKCTINASAVARLAWIRNPGEPVHLGLLVTANADIHNPYVFVGCTIGVLVDVVGIDGFILATVAHDAFAGAILDPGGNNRVYTWVDEPALDPTDLTAIDHLEIRLVNVA